MSYLPMKDEHEALVKELSEKLIPFYRPDKLAHISVGRREFRAVQELTPAVKRFCSEELTNQGYQSIQFWPFWLVLDPGREEGVELWRKDAAE